MKATESGAPFAPTNVYALPQSQAGERYRRRRAREGVAGGLAEAIAPGFRAHGELDLRYFGGKTLPKLSFASFYLGGAAAWSRSDVGNVDAALAAAMTDPHLNNVLAQYFPGEKLATTPAPSQVLGEAVPATVYKDWLEHLAASLHDAGRLKAFDLATTVFCFPLPRGAVLVDGSSKGHAEREEERVVNPALAEHDEAVDSHHGLGGYHGSVHVGGDTVYYATGVYSEAAGGRENGIVAFDAPWKNIVATFYHELVEARTDPDVEDAIRAGNTRDGSRYLGWMSLKDGEIGDVPMEQAGADLGLVMKEVKLASGAKVPIQLMWSNAVHGPEGPIGRAHKAHA